MQVTSTELMLPTALRDRFDVAGVLGEGGQGRAYRGVVRADDSAVVIKHIELAEAASWKDLELFEREIEVLRQLDHPGIPRYLDSHIDLDAGVMLLVREYVEGESLQALLDSETAFEVGEGERLLTELLQILEYLHSLRPAVVHRDIKPANIVRRPDGSFALIDFGGVSARAQLTGGSTFVGTNGYMPAEQLMGRAEPRSDLYALGATTVQMLSGHHPSNLITDGLRMRTDVLPDACAALAPVLARLVEPLPEKRYVSAARVQEVLSGGSSLVLADERLGSLAIRRTPDELRIELPPLHRFQGYLAVGFGAFYTMTAFGSRSVAMMLAMTAVVGIWIIALRLFHRRTVILTQEEMTYERQFGALPTRQWSIPLTEIVDLHRPGFAKYGDLLTVQRRTGKRKQLGYAVAQTDLDRLKTHILQWKEEHAP